MASHAAFLFSHENHSLASRATFFFRLKITGWQAMLRFFSPKITAWQAMLRFILLDKITAWQAMLRFFYSLK